MRFRFPWQVLRWLFYDIEIINCIPQPGVEPDPALTYCGGWNDHVNMGISCIATYSSWDNAYRIFGENELALFQHLVNQSDRIIGFNSISFDDKVVQANGVPIRTSYDLLSQVWVAAGLPPTYTKGVTVAGYNLENLAQTNFGIGKSGSGSLAPVLWQQGKREEVKAYCLRDVYLSVEVLKLGWRGELIDPRSYQKLHLEKLRS